MRFPPRLPDCRAWGTGPSVLRMLALPRALAAAALILAGCASAPPGLAPVDDIDVLLLGEQHDAPRHQRWHAQTVQELAARHRLGAVALEMAEQGRSTAGLSPAADEASVRSALGWDDKAWPWASYAPAVMAAVQAGAPVLGANMPRAAMRQAMQDSALDALVPPAVLARQREAVRNGHCGLLPDAQIGPMTRVQLARDRAMSQTLAAAAQPGRTAVLLAGSGHVDPQLGVPLHLPAALRAKAVAWPAQPQARDYCEQLRRQMAPRP